MPGGKGQVTRPKHVPQRSCVGCGKVKPKHQMLRLVRTGDERVEIDRRGRKAGRGAYVCPDLECWGLALGRNKLGHALRTKLSAPNLEALKEARLRLQAGSEAGEGDVP